MAGRVVLFGATGYTGRLTAQALVDRGARPVLAGRDSGRLEAMAAELGGEAETAVADVGRPASVRELVEEGDVLLTTVGPFARFGAPAVEAAIAAKATYIDSTGEPAFIRRVFEEWARVPRARGYPCSRPWVTTGCPGTSPHRWPLRAPGMPAPPPRSVTSTRVTRAAGIG